MSTDNPFRIDKNRLDRECTQQPELMHEHMMKLAEAKLAAEEASQVYDVIKTQLAQDVREKPGKYNLMKVTESAIQQTVRGHRKYIEAKDLKAKTSYEVDVLQAAVTALAHKKDMLGNLIALWKMDYFSSTNVERDDANEMKKTAARKKGGVK